MAHLVFTDRAGEIPVAETHYQNIEFGFAVYDLDYGSAAKVFAALAGRAQVTRIRGDYSPYSVYIGKVDAASVVAFLWAAKGFTHKKPYFYDVVGARGRPGRFDPILIAVEASTAEGMHSRQITRIRKYFLKRKAVFHEETSHADTRSFTISAPRAAFTEAIGAMFFAGSPTKLRVFGSPDDAVSFLMYWERAAHNASPSSASGEPYYIFQDRARAAEEPGGSDSDLEDA